MFDYMQYEIRCPFCAHLFYQGAGWLLQHPKFPCPEDCGEIISSPILDLSVFVPTSVRLGNDLDLSEWKPKKAPRAAANRASGREGVERGKTPPV